MLIPDGDRPKVRLWGFHFFSRFGFSTGIASTVISILARLIDLLNLTPNSG